MQPNELIKEIEAAKAHLEALEKILRLHQSLCNHLFGEMEYVPIIRKGFHSSGDPEGTMGVDRQLPVDIPTTETPQWQRTCTLCLLTQKTLHVQAVQSLTKTTGLKSTVLVPVFHS